MKRYVLSITTEGCIAPKLLSVLAIENGRVIGFCWLPTEKSGCVTEPERLYWKNGADVARVEQGRTDCERAFIRY
jgi:hypothetical protein